MARSVQRTLQALVLQMVLAGAPALAQTLLPIRIGLIAPLSGGSADFGNSMRHGVQMAVAEINAVGGYLGRPLELVLRLGVYRRVRRLALTIAPVLAVFVAWDLYAIASDHWQFDPAQTLGVVLPGG